MALPSDTATIYALEQELFTAENFPLSRRALAYHIRHNLLLVAELDGKIAGYILALVKRRAAKIYSLGVSAEYRGQKIAVRLLEAISKELIQRGFKRTVLEVRVDNKAAIALYRRSGFTVTKSIKAFYLDGCDAFLMEVNYAG